MLTAEKTLIADVHRGDPRLVGEILRTPGALLHGHFELLSGRHTDCFVAFSEIARDERALAVIADWLLPSLAPTVPDAVVAPRTAGVALGWTLARRLGVPLHLATVDSGGRADGLLGDAPPAGHRLLLVNDVVTTGEGLVALARVVAAYDCEVAGAGWFISRGHVDIEALLGIPSRGVATVELPSWSPVDCRLCTAAEPLQPGLDLN